MKEAIVQLHNDLYYSEHVIQMKLSRDIKQNQILSRKNRNKFGKSLQIT